MRSEQRCFPCSSDAIRMISILTASKTSQSVELLVFRFRKPAPLICAVRCFRKAFCA